METVRLIEQVLVLSIKKFTEEKGLPNDQKSFFISFFISSIYSQCI